MKKYTALIKDKEKLEIKIAELFTKFSNRHGLIITKVEPDINLENIQNKPEFIYNVEITAEI